MCDKIFDTGEKSVRRSLNSQQKDGKKLQISDNRPCSVCQVQMKKVIQRVPFREFISNMKQDKSRKVLIIYTHVMSDGMGDVRSVVIKKGE